MAEIDPTRLAADVCAGDRTALSRAITLIESSRPADRVPAGELLTELLPRAGGSIRVGITGVPGVGKSTLIDGLGMRLLENGHRVAVLAVDPSSTVSGGSILGDKSRMHRLAAEEAAFIRPSPSAGTLGGVARRTRETIVLCEAAGHDVVLVETVGVGQSETLVADMVDTFCLLAIPGAGDELQGIKRGVVELADVIGVNKADGDNLARAEIAVRELEAALRYLRPKHEGWTPPVLPVSAMTGAGIGELWQAILDHRAMLEERGLLSELRREQTLRWMWAEIESLLQSALREHPGVARRLPEVESAVRTGQLSPGAAATEICALFTAGPGSGQG